MSDHCPLGYLFVFKHKATMIRKLKETCFVVILIKLKTSLFVIIRHHGEDLEL